MIGKANAYLYLRQPFVYADTYFTAGDVGGGVMSKTGHKYTDSYIKRLNIDGLQNGSASLQTNNYKSKISYSLSTGSVGHINVIGSKHGAVKIDETHIGRVFNRSLIPTNRDCFFSSGNMGSSNGTVTPSIPVEWTKDGKEDFAVADVYVLEILNTGGTGAAKFRYTTYPFSTFDYKLDSGITYLSIVFREPLLYSDFGTLKKSDSGITSFFNNGYLSKTVSGIYSECRENGNEAFCFVLSNSGSEISIYTDPSLTLLDHTISITNGGSSLKLEYATFANGFLYGITSSGAVYLIDTITGGSSEIAAASQSGTSVAIAANIKQDKVYCIVDGNVRIIDSSDNSVSTPANALNTTPDLSNNWFKRFGFDYEGGIWERYDTTTLYKRDPNTLEILGTLNAYYKSTSQTEMAIFASIICLNTSYDKTRFYDLDLNYIGIESNGRINAYGDYTTMFNPFCGSYCRNGPSYDLTEHVFSNKLSPTDIRRQIYRGTDKDWLIYNGSSWVKGWYKDETPTGDVDSSNTTYTCQNVTTELLAGTLEITVDGSTTVTDNGDGSLSDGGTITYSTGAFTLAAAPTTSVTVNYELTSNAVTGTGIELQDGVVVDFEDGVEAPHFVEGDYFSFTVAEGHVVDNLEEYSASVDLYVVPYHDISDETFTISATAMDVAATVNTGFIKVESDVGLTGTIAGSEATIITSGDPAAGEIKIDYDSGALTFHADDVGSTAVISYRWLERPE